MLDPIDGSRQGSRTHTFHIPNVFTRNDNVAAKYTPLSEGEQDEIVTEVDELSSNPLSCIDGVEASEAWSHLTKLQKVALRLIFGILGAAVLLPFNAIITPSEFYRFLLEDSSYGKSFMSWIVATYNLACIVFGAHATASVQNSSPTRRIVSSSLVIFLVLSLASIIAGSVAKQDIPPSPFISFSILLLMTFTLASAASYLQLAVVTVANAYGPASMGAMLAGQGVVGALLSMIQLFATLSQTSKNAPAPQKHQASYAAVIFFSTNAAFIAAASCFFFKFVRTSVFMEMKPYIIGNSKTSPSMLPSDAQIMPPSNVTGIRRYMNSSVQATYDRIMNVQRKIKLSSFSIAFIFIVTLSVFPALTSRIRPMEDFHTVESSLIFVAWHYITFNISDLIGRLLPTLGLEVFRVRHIKLIVFFTILRTAFIPLLASCNVDDSTASFGSTIFFFLVFLLGISNGFLATTVFVVGPRAKVLYSDEERGMAAGLLSWWLTLGLASGSFASFFIAAV